MRRMLSLLFLAGILLASVAAGEKPNIVFILADDLGYGDLGCYGQKLISTPNLDRMAAEGMKFTQFYAGSTVCAPSRSVLFTGLHTGHGRVRGNAGQKNPLAQSLRPEDITVGKLLKGAGYSTAVIGKWGLGDEGEAEMGLPTRQGFDYFFGYLNQHHAHNYYPSFLIRNEERVALRNEVPGAGKFGQGWATKKIDYAHDLIFDDGLKWVEQNKEKPFLLFLTPTLPHANNEAGRGEGNGQEVPEFGEYADKDWSVQNKGQAAMITRLDRDVGRLLELLKKLNLDEKTLVIFSSDNGPHNEGGNSPKLFNPSGAVRGMKRDLTDGGIRVPFIARWPGKIKAGTVNPHVGYFGDILPTACELAGVAAPEKIDGISLVPTLLGSGEQKKHAFLYWEFHEAGFSQAVLIDGRWKAIRMKRRDNPVQIYDVETDIREEKNLAAEKPELVAKAKELFISARSDSPDWPIIDASSGGGKK
jgi:arylsulfatase A-like enzyme